MFTSLHEGLTQRIHFQYDLDNCHRVPGQGFIRNIELHLPLFLTSEVWIRHEYSIGDIKCTLDYFSAIHLWQLALLYNISTSNSAIKLAFATPESMVYGSKAIVIKKIERVLIQSQQFQMVGSTLDMNREDHVPPIPIHKLDGVQWHQLSALLHTNISLLDVLHFSTSFAWKDIQLIPMWVEKGAIYAIRVIAKETFDNSGRVKYKSLSTRPIDLRINNIAYCGVEEACFFSH